MEFGSFRLRVVWLAGALFGLAAMAPAGASPITWTLHNVAFQSGSTASGSFTFDEGSISNANMMLQFTLGNFVSNGGIAGGTGLNISGNVPLDFTALDGTDEAVFTASLGQSSSIKLLLDTPALVSSLAEAQVIHLTDFFANTSLFWDLGDQSSYVQTLFGPTHPELTLNDPAESGDLDGVGPAPPATTPEPATGALLGTGALLLLGLAWRRRGATGYTGV